MRQNNLSSKKNESQIKKVGCKKNNERNKKLEDNKEQQQKNWNATKNA